jgi:hypothetical protein
MHLLKRLSQHGCRFRAVLCERRHKRFRVQLIPITWQTQGSPQHWVKWPPEWP